jgi:hypothetical protein
MTTSTATANDSKGWMSFLRKHWQLFALFMVAVVSAVTGAVYVARRLVPK